MAISALGVGSGLDLQGLLDGLREAERQRLVPLVQEKQSYQSKISAYGSIKSAVSSLQDALKKLDDSKFYSSTTSSVKGDALNAAASSGAAVGTYSIEVQQLARASSVATHAVVDKTSQLGAGTIKITLGEGDDPESQKVVEVSVAAGKSSLEDIRNAINEADEGVRASIVNDGSGYRLVLASTETGTKAAIAEVDFGELAGDPSDSKLALDNDTRMEARNATLTINNITVESQSNQVEGALEGVTLSLVEEGSVTLDVQIDNEGIKKAINDFVAAYNSLQNQVRSLTGYNAATETGGVLQGDSTTRILQSALRNAISNPGDFGMLSDLGISLELNGSLKVDSEKLDGLMSSDLSKIANFFAGGEGATGFVKQVSDVLDDFAKSDGRLEVAREGLEKSMSRLDDRYLRLERSIEATIARYRTQFAQLDSMIANMNATSGYLAQQFEMMNAQLGRKK